MNLLILVLLSLPTKINYKVEITEIKDNEFTFKAVSPRNEGLPFNSRYLMNELNRMTSCHYEMFLLGEATLGERILIRYCGDSDCNE